MFLVADNGDGWRYPFLLTGVLSGLWVFMWLKLYKKPEDNPKLSAAELEYILSDSEVETT